MKDIFEVPVQYSQGNVTDVMIDIPDLDNVDQLPEMVFVRYRVTGKDYMCCSVFNIMFCNCLFLGCAALICSLKARNKMDEGDKVGAQKYSRYACRTNTAAVLVTILALTLFLSIRFSVF
nr:interferon-induced transmembrane protein 3-like [Misgurnus anguillicaudatus]